MYRVIALLLGKSTINNVHHALHSLEKSVTVNIILARKDMRYLQSQWCLGNVCWYHNFSFPFRSRSKNEILESQRILNSVNMECQLYIKKNLIVLLRETTYLVSPRKAGVQGQNHQIWESKQSECMRKHNLLPQNDIKSSKDQTSISRTTYFIVNIRKKELPK